MTPGTARVSEREAEMLAALGEHLSNAQIASRLHLSVRTVETHVSALLRKLDVSDRRALAALAPSVAVAPRTQDAGVTTWCTYPVRSGGRTSRAEAWATASPTGRWCSSP